MIKAKKLNGEQRRTRILQILREIGTPITGSELARKMNVSRQVIVGDINLLKAKNESIIATSQGYMFFQQASAMPSFEKIMVCRHLPDELENEFHIIVDYGVTIKDISIEHPTFGKITAAILISNRIKVKEFLNKLTASKTPFLSELPVDIHFLTLTSACESALTDVENALEKAGYYIDTEYVSR